MADIVTSAPIDDFMQAANKAAARTALDLGNVDNTSDADKPVSTATQTALDGKAATTRKLDDFGAPDDNTDLDATTLAHGLMPKADKVKLDGVEAAADVTDAGNVGTTIHGASAKTAPVDADELALIDSAASNVLKRVTWANVKAALKTYFDTLYQAALSFGTGVVAALGNAVNGASGLVVLNASSKLPAVDGSQLTNLPSGSTVKAWVNFDGTSAANITTATYSRTLTTVTVTLNAHGYIAGNVVYIDFTSGGALDGLYTITGVAANTFTLTTVASGTIAGGSTMNILRRTIRASSGVHDVTYENSAGRYYINFSTAMTDANYAASVTAGDNANIFFSFPHRFALPTAQAFSLITTNSAVALSDVLYVNVIIAR